MKKRIDTILFILIGSVLGMIAFCGGLIVLKFLFNNPIILVTLFVITIIIEIRDYLKNY